MPPSLQQAIRNKLRAQKIKAYEIRAIMPPVECGGNIEVWFAGLVSGERRAAHYTAYMRDEEGADVELEYLWGWG